MISYIFMGTPPLAAQVLRAVADTFNPPGLVVTQPAREVGRGRKVEPSAVEAFAHDQGWPVLPCENINTEEAYEALKKVGAQYLLVAAFGQILKKPILELCPYALNVHTSLLPKFRGAAPIQRALWAGEKETGVSIQKMVRRLDAGDVLIQKACPIDPKDTSLTLTEKLAALGGKALCEGLTRLEKGDFTFLPQAEEQATYAAKIEKSEGVIDWSQEASAIERQIRACIPWPLAETWAGPARLKVWEAQVENLSSASPPGTVFTDHSSYLKVACGGSTQLSLVQVQPESKKPMPIRSYLSQFRGAYPVSRLGKV